MQPINEHVFSGKPLSPEKKGGVDMCVRFGRFAILVSAFLAICSTTARSKEPEEIWRELNKLAGEERQKLLVSKAREEGEVVWYTSIATDLLEPLRNDFETRHPDIKMKVWRGRGETISNRLLTEAQAGKFGADVIFGANEVFPLLAKAGLLGQYHSPERRFYSQENKDQDGFWTTMSSLVAVIGYNPRMVPKAEAPKGYGDFLNPKWKGTFVIDTSPDRVVMGWMKLWGNEKTEQFLQGLIKNEVAVRSGHSLMAQLLCAGEFKAAIELYVHRAAELKEKGCPLELVFPDPTIGSIEPLSIAKRAPHPHAAALLVDFLLSGSSQKILADRKHYSVRQGIRRADPELDLQKRGIRTLLLNPDDVRGLQRNYFELRERYLLIR